MVALTGPLRATGQALWLSWRAAHGITLRLLSGEPLARRALAHALAQFVWAPLPTLVTLSLLVGLISGVLVARLLAIYSAEMLVIGVLDETLLRQILPLIAGIFASGSVAVEMTARLGAMSLSNEVDALESLGHDPAAHILGAPMLAILAASTLHMLVAAIAALIGAGIPLTIIANVSWAELARIGFRDATAAALLTGMAKSFVFAWLAFAVGAVVGARPVRLPSEIGRRARRAFTLGLLVTFATAALWVAIS